MSEKKEPQFSPETRVHVGQLKESDQKKLESDIASKLRRLGTEMTHKEIRELITAIDTSKNLASLKEKLTGLHRDKDEEILKEIIQIAESIRKWAMEGIQELRVDIHDVLRNTPVMLKKWAFLSEKFQNVWRFEKSELWENIIVDITGFAIGAIDSVIAIAKLIMQLIVDLYHLPGDLKKK